MHSSPFILIVILLVAAPATSQAPGEIAGMIERGELDAASRALVACFPREIAVHRATLLDAIAGLRTTAERRLPLAALIIADPDSEPLQAWLLERIGGHDPAERALAIALAGFLPRPAPELEPAIVKALSSASDVASRLEAAIALGRGGFNSQLGEADPALDALEAAFADREEVVALAAARSWTGSAPPSKRLLAQRDIIRSGRGSKLVGAILAIGFSADLESAQALLALLDDRRVGAAACWALARVATQQELQGNLVRAAIDATERKPKALAELLLDLAALGLDLGQTPEIEEAAAAGDERGLEALIRLGGKTPEIGRVAKSLAETELVARFLGGENAKQVVSSRLAQRPPFAAIWRGFVEAECRGGFDLSALVSDGPPLDRMLRARFTTLDESELAIADPKLAGRFDPAREIWGVTPPLLAGRPGFPPAAKYGALAEKLPPLDRMLFDAAMAYGTAGETSIVAARRVALTVIDAVLGGRDPEVLRKKLPRERGLRFRELADRLWLGLDAGPRRLAVATLFEHRGHAAPGLRPVLEDWADLARDPEIGRRLRARDPESTGEPRPVSGSSEVWTDQGRLEFIEGLAKLGSEEAEPLDPRKLAGLAVRLRRPDECLAPAVAEALLALDSSRLGDEGRFLLLWCFPESPNGNPKIGALRRRLLDEGSEGPEAPALAAYQIASTGSAEEIERIEAALASEYRDQPAAALIGLLAAARVPADLRESLSRAALDASPLLSLLAMDALLRLDADDERGLLEVVMTNLLAKEAERRIAAARILERLRAVSATEVVALADGLEFEDIGAARLALALGRLGRPDPRLRRRLELATCSSCLEKRVAARIALEMLWTGLPSPVELLLDWTDSRPELDWREILASVPRPPGPSQVEILLASLETPPYVSTRGRTRLVIIDAACRLAKRRGQFEGLLAVPLDDPQWQEIDPILKSIAAEGSEEK